MDNNKTNNDPNRLITVAIHTFDRAVELKNTLEDEGIEVVLHNVNLDEKVLASGVRVRIRERDLPLALQVIESPEAGTIDKRCVLLPVDFSKYSLKSVRLGMEYARRSRGKVLLLHSYISERHTMSLPFGSDRYDSPEDEVKAIKKDAKQRMSEFVQMLQDKIAAGELPKVKIETKVTEGIPEEQILHYAQKYDVALIVMGTSGTNRRRQNLIGSVAGEVMDACKFPIFTVPIGMPDVGLSDITHVAFFSNLAGLDLIRPFRTPVQHARCRCHHHPRGREKRTPTRRPVTATAAAVLPRALSRVQLQDQAHTRQDLHREFCAVCDRREGAANRCPQQEVEHLLPPVQSQHRPPRPVPDRHAHARRSHVIP